MCGIAGLIHRGTSGKVGQELLATLLVAIRHLDRPKKLVNRLWKLSSSPGLSAGHRVLAMEALEGVGSKKLLRIAIDRYLSEPNTYMRAALVRFAAREVTPALFKLVSDHYGTVRRPSSQEGETVRGAVGRIRHDVELAIEELERFQEPLPRGSIPKSTPSHDGESVAEAVAAKLAAVLRWLSARLRSPSSV